MSYKTNAICLISRQLLICMLFWLPATAQYNFSGVDAVLSRNQKALGNNVVVLAYKDDSLVYKKELGEYFTVKTSAPIGDAGQWLAAATIMTFVDQGKLKLDDPVAKYLPIFGKYAKGYLTIRHCLSNTTGIETEKGKLGKVFGGKRKFATLEEEVDAIAAKEISNNPEKEFHYGNLGINIAARVVEVIGKKSFDRLVQERITRPLKMRGTNFTDENGGAVNPALGAKSTPNDYLSFLVMIMKGGMFEGKQILSQKSIDEMQKPQFVGLPVVFKPAQANGFDYALGHWISGDVLIFPGAAGTWGIIDKCRKYAAVVFVKKANDDAPQNIWLDLRSEIDEQIPCKK